MGATATQTGLDWLASFDVSTLLAAALPIWVCGAVIGLLLPRPKWLESGIRSSALFLSTPPGTFLRRMALLFHGAVIIREVWYYFFTPGTMRAFARACWQWAHGHGFSWPLQPEPVEDLGEACSVEKNSGWYITNDDLEFFKRTVEEGEALPGTGKWDTVCDKSFEDWSYLAERRSLPNGKTEYKSVTITQDASAEEFMDFYLDDPTRPTWDTMISQYDVIENGDAKQRCQVVHWIRSFPFSFITDREYVIARRIFRAADGSIYGITKSVQHPNAPKDTGLVSMDVFYSMWRCRNIPCPKGSGKPACETILLHHEQFKIPENLAKFAVRHGMLGFVKKMGPAVREFIDNRRKRCDAFEVDSHAYGLSQPRIGRSYSVASTSALSSSVSSEYSLTESEGMAPLTGELRRHRRHHKSTGSLRKLAAVALVSGAALVLNRSASTRQLQHSRSRHHMRAE